MAGGPTKGLKWFTAPRPQLEGNLPHLHQECGRPLHSAGLESLHPSSQVREKNKVSQKDPGPWLEERGPQHHFSLQEAGPSATQSP